MMNKKRNDYLIAIADKALYEENNILRDGCIKDGYNGQTAALGVTIAMSGLLPALAIYIQEGSESRGVDRKNILDVIGKMIHEDEDFSIMKEICDARTLWTTAIAAKKEESEFKQLQKEVIDCSIALKQVIRTYNLV